MIETFQDALRELIDEWRRHMTDDEIISALELRVVAMKESGRHKAARIAP